jgi:Protein of unknown function (DUF3570)
LKVRRVARSGTAGRRVATSLFAATASLLGASSRPSIAQEVDRTWKFDTSLSYYGEADRVTDLSANVLARHSFRRGLLSLRLAFDSLTGASASGATPSRFVQTFTSPSGHGSYTIAPRTTPLDPTFLDTRVALSANWLQTAGARGEIDLGVSASNEYDYFHTGLNGHYSIGLNERNTTLAFGLAFAADKVDPVGGTPVPLAPMLPPGAGGNKLGDDSKTVTDALFGVTQVFGRATIGQFNYSFSLSSGYLTDPYKVLSEIDPATGDPVAGPGIPFLYLFETRPDTRTKHSLFGQIKHRIGRPVVDVSYRFMTDDWGVDSHTLELRWRQPIGSSWYVQPHLRYYTQSAADFYRPYLRNGDPLPDHASADYRLGEMVGTTLGIKLGRPYENAREWSVRVEYYRQSGRAPPGATFGSLDGFDLFPTVNALISQIEYRF